MTVSADLRDRPKPVRGASDPGLGFAGFVALMASLMAINALGIDSMLPALPAIGREFGVANENQRQWIIAIYVLGFGVAQIVWGPLADRYGRKPILVGSMALFAALSAVVAVSASFHLLLAARLLQGIAASASRVLVISIVRDCFSGRRMAKVMSLSFIVFLAVPILAPSIGQVIVAATGSWRAIFLALGGYAAAVAVIAGLRLRETLHADFRQPLSFGGVGYAMRRVLLTRAAIGYTLAAAFVFGGLMGFINSVQQVFTDVFHDAKIFPVLFACIAATMGLASFLNSKTVERVGTRRISHAALLGFVACGSVHLTWALAGRETMLSFVLLQAATMFCFGLVGSNFNSMAMEPMGEIAGTAASVQGFISTCIGALLGLVVGQLFDGTTVPLAAGFTLFGVASLGIVLWAERGRLFRPQNPQNPQPAAAAAQ